MSREQNIAIELLQKKAKKERLQQLTEKCFIQIATVDPEAQSKEWVRSRYQQARALAEAYLKEEEKFLQTSSESSSDSV